MDIDILRRGRGKDFGFLPMISDLYRACQRSKGEDRLKLLWWIFVLHLRPPSAPLHSLKEFSLPVIQNNARFKAELRYNQSDLYTFAEVFLRDVYQDGISTAPRNIRTIVDLGAHIGLASLLFSLSFPEAHVICVEPIAENVAVLHRNMMLNNLSWDIVQKAVGEVDGAQEFYGSEWWSSGTIVSTVGQARSSDPRRPESFLALPRFNVEVTTVTSLLNYFHIEFVDILKMDIEGAETLIINEEAHWLSRVGLLLLDLHYKYIDPKPLLQTLDHFNFIPYGSSHNHCRVFINRSNYHHVADQKQTGENL